MSKDSMALIDQVIKWASAADRSKVDEWLEFEAAYLKIWGWNDKAIACYKSWGKGGFNNDLLHFDTHLKDFYSEVNYASDRMSMDRLFRCHCKYQTLIRADKE
jgi:hypothetical protein